MSHSARTQPEFARRLAELLCLAAAPSFAIMALLAGLSGNRAPDGLCSLVHGASAAGGMVLMYLLMSVFHLPPWLRLLSAQAGAADQAAALAVRKSLISRNTNPGAQLRRAN